MSTTLLEMRRRAATRPRSRPRAAAQPQRALRASAARARADPTARLRRRGAHAGARRRAARAARPAARARRRSTARSATAATRAWSPSGSGPAGTLVAIDRDPLAEERFEALAAEVPLLGALHPRRLRRGARAARRARALRADIAYFDLGMSSMQVDTRERGFSYSYDAPLDMRMDPGQELSAREIVAEWDERRLARVLRDYGEERHAGAIARAIVRRRAQRADRDDARARRDDQLGDPRAGALRRRPPRQALLPGAADRRQRRARPARRGRCRSRGACCARAACSPAISFHSLEDRRVKRFLVERARGCICPPDLPVCACGREPRGGAAHAPLDRALGRRRSRATRAPPRRACAPRASSTDGGRRADDAASAAARRAAARAPSAARRPPRRRPRRAPRRVVRPGAPRAPARSARRARRRATAALALGAARGARRRSRSHRLLDRLIRGRVWIGLRRVRADRDRRRCSSGC